MDGLQRFVSFLKEDEIKKEDFVIPFSNRVRMSIQEKHVPQKPPPYKKIRSNIYLTSKPPLTDIPNHKCKCNDKIQENGGTMRTVLMQKQPPAAVAQRKVKSAACDDSCINRMMFIECNDASCSLDDHSTCCNRQLTRRESPAMNVIPMTGKGFGLLAMEPILKGRFVIEYIGEVIDDDEMISRLQTCKMNGEKHFYLMEIERDAVIDARYRSNAARFINHSCNPNCATQKWNVNGLVRVGIFALTDIAPHEEITMDYKFNHFGEESACHCGAKNCSGQMRSQRSDVLKTAAVAYVHPTVRPVFLSSLPAIKHSQMLPLELSQPPSGLFITHSGLQSYQAVQVHLESIRTISTCTVKRNNHLHYLNSVLEKVRNMSAHSCGGILDWTETLMEFPVKSNAIVLRRLVRHNLLQARERRLRQMEAFTTGTSKWNKRLCLTPIDFHVNRLDRFLQGVRTKNDVSITISDDLNEDHCFRCSQPGELICCDGCPAAFHLSCSDLYSSPSESTLWFCPPCRIRKKATETALRNKNKKDTTKKENQNIILCDETNTKRQKTINTTTPLC